jgi:hypothetical protein
LGAATVKQNPTTAASAKYLSLFMNYPPLFTRILTMHLHCGRSKDQSLYTSAHLKLMYPSERRSILSSDVDTKESDVDAYNRNCPFGISDLDLDSRIVGFVVRSWRPSSKKRGSRQVARHAHGRKSHMTRSERIIKRRPFGVGLIVRINAYRVGVGIRIAQDPLHGSGQAGFPHPALALGNDAHAA